MSKINYILGTDNFELIRSRIAQILLIELTEQKALNIAALAIEITKPTPDPLLIAEYELNISCIPDKVWEERFIRPTPQDYPMLNVVFTNAPLNEAISHSTQIGEDKFQVEAYTDSDSKEKGNGDVLATFKLHRLLAICRKILMDRNYVKLEFEVENFIGYRKVEDIVIAQPQTGADNAKHSIYGKLDLLVKCGEYINDLSGIPFAGTDTTYRIFDTEKGYFWQVEAA